LQKAIKVVVVARLEDPAALIVLETKKNSGTTMIFSDLATPPLGSALSLFPSLLFFSLSLSLSLSLFFSDARAGR